MTPEKVLVIQLDPLGEDDDSLGLTGPMLDGRDDNFLGLTAKYADRQINDDPSKVQQIHTVRLTPSIGKTPFNKFPVTKEEIREIRKFAQNKEDGEGPNDLGLILVSNYSRGMFSDDAFDAKVLAGFVNELEIQPRKISIVSCGFGSSGPQEPIWDFLNGLDIEKIGDPPPVIASYVYPVFIESEEEKRLGTKSFKVGGLNIREKERLSETQKMHYKRYFKFDPEKKKWGEVDRHLYTDNRHGLPPKDNPQFVFRFLADALDVSEDVIKMRSPKNPYPSCKVLYVGAESVYLQEIPQPPKRPTPVFFPVPLSQLIGIDANEIQLGEQLEISLQTIEGKQEVRASPVGYLQQKSMELAEQKRSGPEVSPHFRLVNMHD